MKSHWMVLRIGLTRYNLCIKDHFDCFGKNGQQKIRGESGMIFRLIQVRDGPR